MDPKLIDMLLTAGPIGFGLVCLIVIWRYIVAPELQASRNATAQYVQVNAEIATQLRIATSMTRDIARLQARVSRQTLEEEPTHEDRG